MLRQSYPWKRELRRLRSQIARIAAGPFAEEMDDYALERPLLYSAIVVRRLIESWKVTDRTRLRRYRVTIYPTRPGRADTLTRLTMAGDIEDEFFLDRPQRASMDAWDIVCELLHTGFINWEVNRRDQISAIYMASKRNQKTRLVRISTKAYLDLLERLIVDHVERKRTGFDDLRRLKIELA
ncbi:MAG: hypothetical protein QM759_12420 [Terricaulis sp.]